MRRLTLLLAAGPLMGAPTFVKDVMPVLNKASCTSGPCHGGAKGKNGFKLSLRGYDPEFDYRAIVHDMSGRRFNRTEPSNSLVLLKPTMELAHGGGQRFESELAILRDNSRLDRRWREVRRSGFGHGIEAGGGTRRVLLRESQARRSPEGQAHYADASQRDVTKDAIYTSNTPQVAEVNDDGVIKTVRKGEAAMLVRYEGKLAVMPVTVVTDKPGFAWGNASEFNYIDRLNNEKLRRLKILPSELSGDAEFCAVSRSI